jgi:hypothetical protein
LDNPYDVFVYSSGDLFIADAGNHTIRKVNSAGVISTVAGSGTQGFSGDGGPATSAQFYTPWGVVVDSAGNLYIADRLNSRVRMVNTAGVISTIAGTGVFGQGGDGGPATTAELEHPVGLALDAVGNLYIAEKVRVRKVDTSGVITTVAGDGTTGYSGDGGPATSAQLNNASDVALDSTGNLYIADADNNVVRKVDPGGTITTVPGTSTAQFLTGVEVDSADNLYFADKYGTRIRMVDAAGTVTTVAGDGTEGFSGDGGPATSAQLNNPSKVAVDSAGILYIADQANHSVRRVELDLKGPCRFAIDPRRAVVDADGDTHAALVTPSDDACVWRADTEDDWLRVLEPHGAMAGIGNLVYRVFPNAGSSGRTGEIRAGSATHVVRQNKPDSGGLEDPPEAPSKLTADRINSVTVELTWKDVNGETGYQLKRRGRAYKGGSDSMELATDTTRFVDRGLTRSTRYCYSLRAVGPGGASDQAKVCIRTPR